MLNRCSPPIVFGAFLAAGLALCIWRAPRPVPAQNQPDTERLKTGYALCCYGYPRWAGGRRLIFGKGVGLIRQTPLVKSSASRAVAP